MNLFSFPRSLHIFIGIHSFASFTSNDGFISKSTNIFFRSNRFGSHKISNISLTKGKKRLKRIRNTKQIFYGFGLDERYVRTHSTMTTTTTKKRWRNRNSSHILSRDMILEKIVGIQFHILKSEKKIYSQT